MQTMIKEKRAGAHTHVDGAYGKGGGRPRQTPVFAPIRAREPGCSGGVPASRVCPGNFQATANAKKGEGLPWGCRGCTVGTVGPRCLIFFVALGREWDAHGWQTVLTAACNVTFHVSAVCYYTEIKRIESTVVCHLRSVLHL